MRPGEKKGIIKQLKEFFSKRPKLIRCIIKEWAENPGDIRDLIIILNKIGYDTNQIGKDLFEEKIREFSEPWDIIWLIDILNKAGYNVDKISGQVFEERVRKINTYWELELLVDTLEEARYDINQIGKGVIRGSWKRCI